MSSNTLYDKVWDQHQVAKLATGQDQLFVGLHLIHEVTSPQAFIGGETSEQTLHVRRIHHASHCIAHRRRSGRRDECQSILWAGR